VAERLSHEPNASAYVTAAVRRAMRVELVRASLENVGIKVTDEGIAHWRAKFAELDAAFPPEERKAAWERTMRRLHERWEAEA